MAIKTYKLYGRVHSTLIIDKSDLEKLTAKLGDKAVIGVAMFWSDDNEGWITAPHVEVD